MSLAARNNQCVKRPIAATSISCVTLADAQSMRRVSFQILFDAINAQAAVARTQV